MREWWKLAGVKCELWSEIFGAFLRVDSAVSGYCLVGNEEKMLGSDQSILHLNEIQYEFLNAFSSRKKRVSLHKKIGTLRRT